MQGVDTSVRRGPPRRNQGYAGRSVVLATRHEKDAAIAPVFGERLDMTVIVPDGIDTDALGTFTGEIERPGDMRETARLKAGLALDATGEGLALASEGAYGAHAAMPYFASGSELMIFVDVCRSIEIVETIETPRTNFASMTARPGDPLDAFLSRVGFPEHALVVSPNARRDGDAFEAAKGVRDRGALHGAIDRLAASSADGRALLQSDMRAHMNPTRMRAIADVAGRLASRLMRHCPECRSPGFGWIGRTAGLPCSECEAPTAFTLYETHGCAACSFERRMLRPDGRRFADPAYCNFCNP